MTYPGTGTLSGGVATINSAASWSAGIDLVSASYTGDANYAGSTGTTSVSVAPAQLTITADAQNKVYGTTDPALTYEYTGLVNGDTGSVFSGGLARTTGSDVGTYSITQGTLSAGPNYTVNFTGATLTITPAALTVAGVLATGKTYDGTTAAALNTSAAVLQGLIIPENVALVASSATGMFVDPNAGSGIAVAASGFAITGPGAGNYTLAQPTGLTADITQAILTITAADQARSYGFGGSPTSLGTTGYRLTGTLYGADSLTGVTLSTRAPVSGSWNYAAGNWSIVPSATTGAGLSNYLITFHHCILTVSQLPLGITGFTVANKVYNATTIATVTNAGTLSGLLSGDGVGLDSSSAVASFSNPSVGTGKLVTGAGFALSGPDAGNYTLTQPTTSAEITAPPDDTVAGTVWVDEGEDQTYDPGDPGLADVTVTLSDTSGNSVVDVYGNTVLPVTTDASGAYKFSNLPAGSYTVSFAAPAGYQLEPSWQSTWSGPVSTPGLNSILNVGATNLAYDVIDDYPGDITSFFSTVDPPPAW